MKFRTRALHFSWRNR